MKFGLFGTFEKRANPLENPAIPLDDAAAMMGIFDGGGPSANVEVSELTALGVPAIAAAVNIIAGTIASLPLHLYSGREGSTKRAENDPLNAILHDRWNPEETSYAGRKRCAIQLLLKGRAIVFIERNKAGRVTHLWPMDTERIQVERRNKKRFYVWQPESGGRKEYAASEVLDLVLLPCSDGISHYNPIRIHREAIGSIIAAERYASRLFANGGVPPVALQMPPNASPAAASRAANDIHDTLMRARDENRNILVVPQNHRLEPIGFDPMKQQLLELRKFQVSEVSRIFNIAPAMLHDLSTGTYSNVEQQDLNFTKHTIRPLTEMFEQEMNAKLFSARNSNYVEFNLDGLMRGDFKTRMEGLSRGVMSAIYTPNEARALENRPALEGGDELFIQGATVPLSKAGEQPAPKEPTQEEAQTQEGEGDDE